MKKTAKDMPMAAKMPEMKPRTSVMLSEGEISGVGLGERVEVRLTGKVVGLGKDSYVEGHKKYRLELEDYSCSVKGNAADKSMREMGA